MSTHIQSVTFPAADGGPLLEGILHLIPRTDHFFAGRETEVAALVTDFVTVHQGDLRCQGA